MDDDEFDVDPLAYPSTPLYDENPPSMPNASINESAFEDDFMTSDCMMLGPTTNDVPNFGLDMFNQSGENQTNDPILPLSQDINLGAVPLPVPQNFDLDTPALPTSQSLATPVSGAAAANNIADNIGMLSTTQLGRISFGNVNGGVGPNYALNFATKDVIDGLIDRAVDRATAKQEEINQGLMAAVLEQIELNRKRGDKHIKKALKETRRSNKEVKRQGKQLRGLAKELAAHSSRLDSVEEQLARFATFQGQPGAVQSAVSQVQSSTPSSSAITNLLTTEQPQNSHSDEATSSPMEADPPAVATEDNLYPQTSKKYTTVSLGFWLGPRANSHGPLDGRLNFRLTKDIDFAHLESIAEKKSQRRGFITAHGLRKYDMIFEVESVTNKGSQVVGTSEDVAQWLRRIAGTGATWSVNCILIEAET